MHVSMMGMQLVGRLPGTQEALAPQVKHGGACDSNTREVAVEGSEVQGRLRPRSESGVSLGYRRSCFKNKTQQMVHLIVLFQSQI